MKKIIAIISVILILEIAGPYGYLYSTKPAIRNVSEIAYQLPTPVVTETKEQPKNVEALLTKKQKIKKIVTQAKAAAPVAKPTINMDLWGVSKQVSEHTWTIRIGDDEVMAKPQEIFEALNNYRQIHGSQILTWNEKLASYAHDRAVILNGLKTVDQHKGFNDYMENQDGFNKLGFTSVGENISFGYKLNGVHTIEWMYAGDKPHNDNQLNNIWNYVGVGVDGLATCIIFGTGKM